MTGSGRAAAGAGALALLGALLFPVCWTLVASVTPDERLFDPGAANLLAALTLDHYRALFDERAFLIPIRNSLIVAGVTTVVVMPVATLCAYALARLPLPRPNALLALVLAVSMFPQISIVPPLYLVLRELRLIDTYPGLVLPYLTFTMPLAIWLLTGFFRQLPRDLEDAAMLDGAPRVRALREIVLPLAAPGLASTAILTFLYCWNEFLFALSFTLGPDRHTVPVAIALFRGRYQVPWGEVLAAAIVATVPVALIVLAFQRRVVAGLTAGAMKG
jgi:ABC-type glycerol-3-phosphate transport system permease component